MNCIGMLTLKVPLYFFYFFDFNTLINYSPVVTFPFIGYFRRNNVSRLMIISLSLPDDPRQVVSYEGNLKYINEKTRHSAMFITKKGENKNNYPIIEPHEELDKLSVSFFKKDGNKDRAVKRISACKYFIENTSYDYLWVGTDDLFFDIEAIDPMLADLNSKFDTSRDIVLKGHNIQIKEVFFLQGGSGWIVSRAGALAISEVGKKWIKNIKLNDDMEVHNLRKMLKLSISDLTCHYMYGHDFNQNVSYGFWKYEVPQCPKTLVQTEMHPHNILYPLRELVGFHCWPNKGNEALNISNSLIDAKHHDSSLYMHFDSLYMTICRKI